MSCVLVQISIVEGACKTRQVEHFFEFDQVAPVSFQEFLSGVVQGAAEEVFKNSWVFQKKGKKNEV